MRIFTITFIADAAERAVSTAAGTAAAVLSAGAFNLLNDVPWYSVASVAGLAALIDVLRSLSAAREGNPGTASFGTAVASSMNQYEAPKLFAEAPRMFTGRKKK